MMKTPIILHFINMPAKVILTFLLFLTMFPAMGHSQVNSHNPVTRHDWADPTVWQADDGYYYSMATGGRSLIRSTDLRLWQETDISPFNEETWKRLHQIGKHLWAPDVTSVGGQRIAYVTMYRSAEDASIVALKEVSPGHFEYTATLTQGKVTGILDTIDPEVVTDTRSGRVWLFFGSIGGVHRVELTKDGFALKDGAEYEHVAGLTMEQDGSRMRVFEGSYLYRRKGYWYLFVSAGWYNNASYHLCVGRSRRLTGTFRDKEGHDMRLGYATTILSSQEGDRFFGPGHCGEIISLPDGRDYITYHCHDREMGNGRPRPMMLQQITWDKDGWPVFTITP